MLRPVGSYQHITYPFIFRTYCNNYVDESNKIEIKLNSLRNLIEMLVITF